uniref:Chitinase domain-containing protein 1 n=1 Tax=Heterorhabditis bacteriophora TaxID=37862 RepID=A0A1I7XUK1_HETBA
MFTGIQTMFLRTYILCILFEFSYELGKSDRKHTKTKNVLLFPPESVRKHTVLNDNDNVDYSNKRRFGKPVLAYITPLTPQGVNTRSGCEILGTHDIDRDWLEELRKNNSALKVVPRVLFDNWPVDDITRFFQNEIWSNRCMMELTNFLARNQFDGAVVELWTSTMVQTRGLASQYMVELLNSWGNAFHMKNMEIIVPVGPPLSADYQQTGMFSTSFLHELTNVDYVQIMTYDYSSQSPAGIAPYTWVEQSISTILSGSSHLADKLLLGVNYYGYEYSHGRVEPVIFDRFLSVLKETNTELEWDTVAKEHMLKTSDSVIYYPSLTSIELRLNLARNFGIGVGIWDYGQGLNYFSQLL